MEKFTKQKQHKDSLCRCTSENPESDSDGLENNISHSGLPGFQQTYNSKVLPLECFQDPWRFSRAAKRGRTV